MIAGNDLINELLIDSGRRRNVAADDNRRRCEGEEFSTAIACWTTKEERENALHALGRNFQNVALGAGVSNLCYK